METDEAARLTTRPILGLRNVCKSYSNGAEILRGIDLDIHDGSLSAIVGPSGSGKSTLLNIMGLLDQPDSGEITLHGKDVTGLSPNEAAVARGKIFGFVFQAFHLLPGLSVIDNVGLPLQFQGINRTRRRELSAHRLDLVGLSGKETSYPSELSGGEQQRVAIARSLVGEPRILLADEPTGNLDQSNSDRIFTLLANLNKRLGITVVIVTHDRRIAELCKYQIRVSSGDVACTKS